MFSEPMFKRKLFVGLHRSILPKGHESFTSLEWDNECSGDCYWINYCRNHTSVWLNTKKSTMLEEYIQLMGQSHKWKIFFFLVLNDNDYIVTYLKPFSHKVWFCKTLSLPHPFSAGCMLEIELSYKSINLLNKTPIVAHEKCCSFSYIYTRCFTY